MVWMSSSYFSCLVYMQVFIVSIIFIILAIKVGATVWFMVYFVLLFSGYKYPLDTPSTPILLLLWM